MWYLILIISTHFMADFVFQSRKIANAKHNSVKYLLYHCAIYTIILFVALTLPFHFRILQVLLYCLINGYIHLLTDWATSYIAFYYYRRISKEKHFWVTIGFDQLLHTATLIITAYYFLQIKF